MINKIPNLSNLPAAWKGEYLSKNENIWIKEFNNKEIIELENEANKFLKTNNDLSNINSKNFYLPNLSDYLTKIREELKNGIGFKLLRGIPVEKYDIKQLAAMYFGIGVHIGSPRSQNAKGHLLGHIKDLGLNLKDKNVRVYQTNERQHFHTDSCDAVGLLCLRGAKSGGMSMLCSTITLYNEFKIKYPDLLKYLFNPISRDRRGEIPIGKKPFYNLPVLHWYKNKLTGVYHRPYIDSAQNYKNAIKMCNDHKLALDKFDEIANDSNIHLKMDFLPGDIQFVYNHSILHDRTSYVDWEEDEKKRHLLRLWLSLPDDRALPISFAQRYGSIKIGDRGGIITQNTNAHVPLFP